MRFFRLLVLACLAACVGVDGNGDGDAGDAGDAGAKSADVSPARRRTASAPGAIAYVGAGGRELRLVMPDGSGDRAVWRLTDTLYSIRAPAWRPDGTEIAFASDHEMAMSLYERDVYAIGPDGSGLRRITNAPAHAELASRRKGTVTVTVLNASFDGGPYFVYVLGAAEPKRETLPAARATKLTFDDVADLGDGVAQPVVVISGIRRWWDAAAAADVQPGRTVDAGAMTLTTPIEHYGADGPFWSPDGRRVAFFLGPTCLLRHVPAEPAPGPSYGTLLDPEVFGPTCAVDWAPGASTPNPLLVVDMRDFTESGTTHVLRVGEGSRERGAPVVSFDRYVLVMDLRWLPDGSGFVVARQDDLVDEDVNLYEFTFATRQLRKITDLTGEMVRHFSVSPDGRSIVFERVGEGSIREIESLPSDLWIVGRDGSGLRPLVKSAAYPAWNPR